MDQSEKYRHQFLLQFVYTNNVNDLLLKHIYPIQLKEAKLLVQFANNGAFMLTPSQTRTGNSQEVSIDITANINGEIKTDVIQFFNGYWYLANNSDQSVTVLLSKINAIKCIIVWNYDLQKWEFMKKDVDPGQSELVSCFEGKISRNPKRKSTCKKRRMIWIKSKRSKSYCRKNRK